MRPPDGRRVSARPELRKTADERDLVDRAAAAAGSDLTEFVVTNAVDAARRLLAERERFELDEGAIEQWEALNARPARDLPGPMCPSIEVSASVSSSFRPGSV